MINPSLLSLLHLSDPTLPIGAFAHSSGLETYVQQRAIRNRADAETVIRNFLAYSLHYTDAALVSLAYDAAASGDRAALQELDATCEATKPASETRAASRKLGLRLLKLFAPLCRHEFLEHFRSDVTAGLFAGHYCIAFGTIAAFMSIPKQDALLAFYYNAAVGLVTNSVKLVPLGQQEGQELLFGLHAKLQELAQASMTPDRDRIGLSCPGIDIRCMQHQFLYSRLYMS
jgi:urease accessory protein